MSTKHKRTHELLSRLQNLGFTCDEAFRLKRIESALQRWAERECGDGSGTAIERDEITGKPYVTYERGPGKPRGRYGPIPDREQGAIRRLKTIVAARNARDTGASPVLAYHQGDCRGCMVYLVTQAQLGDQSIASAYTRGLAVCV